jgi:hypothetical protein
MRADVGAEPGATVESDSSATRVRCVLMRPVSGRKPFSGSSEVMRHCSAAPQTCTLA